LTDDDPFNLQRFLDAQQGCFEDALDEIRAGRKRTHWMWFVFPQLAGLGRSETARYFGIRSPEEARAYLDHPSLGPRLIRTVEALHQSQGTDAESVFGGVDARKLCSSLTLFASVSSDPIFPDTLERWCMGADEATLRLLASRDKD